MVDVSVCPDAEEFWTDLSAAYAEDVDRLAAQGCTSSSSTPGRGSR